MLQRTALLLAPALALAGLATAQSSTPKAQAAADQRAYVAARNAGDPAARVAALQKFVKDFPDSNRVSRAQSAIFTLLVENFPDRTKDIEEQSKLILRGEKDFGKWHTEELQSFELANAGPAGVDLPYAEKLAKDSYDRTTEAAYDKETARYYPSSPHLSAADLANQHARFVTQRSEVVTALGLVYLHQGKLVQAKTLADEAYKLDPTVDDANALLGEIALKSGDSATALADFERAQLLGSLKADDRKQMVAIYKAAHNGSDAGMVEELDAAYTKLFPAPFQPAVHKPVVGGHTALLELYTGSGCPPCVGGDLAVDAMLEAYPRTELVALAFDLHIPEPDPLTNPDTVARAAVYGVGSTPSYVLDGTKLGAFGGQRSGSEDLYKKLTKLLDPAIAKPSAVRLELAATPGANGKIAVHAAVTLPDFETVQQELKAPPAPPTDPKAPLPLGPVEPERAGNPILYVNFALVEDDIRYSGENGVRFHRMVVRALAKPASNGFLVVPGESTKAEATFDPAAISAKLAAYLDGYEQKNDRFGPLTFLSKDTNMRPGHLAIAAWVQDSVTHRILQSAFVPLTPAGRAEGTR